MQDIIEPNFDQVPSALTSLNQWVVWKAVPDKKRPGKFTKVPYNPTSHHKASSTKARDWGTFEEACSAYISGTGYSGIGFVFSQNDDLIGTDLDACFNADGELTEEAQYAVDTLGSYTERSPSGKGLHIICRGRLPGAGHCDKPNGREMYQEGRFFTITADIVGGFGEVEDRKKEVRELYERWWGTDSVENFNATDLVWDKTAEILPLDKLNISDYTRNLIINGEGMDDFQTNEGDPDRSNAMFYVTRELVASGANKETILTILTDKDYYLAQPALERRSSRKSAIQWAWKYTVAKLFTQRQEEKALFEDLMDEETEEDDGIDDSVLGDTAKKKTTESEDGDKIPYVKGNFEKNALLFLKSGVPIVRFREQFFRYTGKHWTAYDDELLERDVQVSVKGRGFTMSQINNTIKTVKRFCTKDNFKAAPTLIALNNGVIDLDGWDCGIIDDTLQEHSTKHKTMSLLNFDYNPKATCPQWDEFLEEVFEEDQERVRLLQQFMGYVLVYDYRWQKMLVMAGESRSGKGTIADVIHTLVGSDCYKGTNISKLGSQYGLHQLIDAKVAVIGDAKQAARGNINQSHETLLNITGNDYVTIERKHKTDLTMKLPARLIMMANSVPRFADEADALFNRYLVLVFNKSFAGREDVDLGARLRTEASGIFNWAIRGLIDLGESGRFIETAAGRAKADEMRVFNNPVGSFVELFVYKDDLMSIRTDDMFDLYERFCEGIEIKPTSKIDFSRKLLKLAPWIETTRETAGDRNKYYEGVGVDHEKMSEYIATHM